MVTLPVFVAAAVLFLLGMMKLIFWLEALCPECKTVAMKYRNPADRTCPQCGRHEQQFCNDWRDVYRRDRGWWEPMNRPADD